MPDEPIVEFATPGPLRDRLVALVVSGHKRATTGLLAEYQLENQHLPQVGDRFRVIDSAGEVVGVIETAEVSIARLADVPVTHARDEGEGHATVADWRRDHETFWRSGDFRAVFSETFIVDDDTLVVLERFRLVE